MTSTHNFQVDLRGVIQLLSDHLYSGPQVFLRELLQNAVDAITARQHVEPQHQGEISLQSFGDSERVALLVSDNGIGLTEQEVHQFLATIGQSSKRDDLYRQDFLGQFGIGLLSAFVVSEEIVVITRSLKANSQPVEFRGRADGTYTIRTLERELAPGSQVFLTAKSTARDYFTEDAIYDTARHYGRHLPYSIHVVAGNRSRSINEIPPWQRSYGSRQAQLEAHLAYGQETFGESFLDAIPLSSTTGGVSGIAYVLAHSASLASKRAHRVYLKNMLLSEQADNLLPEWAFFVKCVVNATGLRPTAARESFYEDENLSNAREALGQCLRAYLVDLAQNDPARLNRIIDLHYLPIKALAVEDDEFYRLFIEWLPFETSLGTMTLGEYCQRNPSVRFVSTRDQFRQIASIAAAQGICLVNAGYTYDRELLEKLHEVFASRDAVEVDATELSENFEDLTLDQREEAFGFVQLAQVVLQPFRCSAEIRRFAPAQLPTLYTTNTAADFMRSVEQSKEVSDELWSGVLDKVAEESAAVAETQLCFNYNNPLISKLVRVTDRQLLKEVIEMLYVQALLLGHYPLKMREMRLLSSGMLALIERSIAPGEAQP